MFHIKIYNNISQSGLRLFTDQYQIARDLSQPDAILLRSQNLHEEALPDSLLAVIRAGVGVNNIPVDLLTQRGIPVFNTPGANANAVKELVIAGMLLAARNLCRAWEYTQTLPDENLKTKVEAGKKQFAGTEVAGKTLGVIGLGAIGVKVANAALSLGMHVIGYDPMLSVQRAWELSPDVVQANDMDDLLGRSDFVSLHVPLNESTKKMLNSSRLVITKPGLIVVNMSREEVVDEAALMTALKQKKLSYYVTDFPSKELLKMQSVIALPHLGASTKEAEENCAQMAVNQLQNFLEHGIIVNSVNFPEINISQVSRNLSRLAIANANVPNMVGQISTCLAAADINIADLINKSKGDIAYTVLDLDSKPGQAVVDALKSIKGILKVRIINRGKNERS